MSYTILFTVSSFAFNFLIFSLKISFDSFSLSKLLNIVLNKNSYLANRDLLTIEYLKMKNFQLYRTIYENRKFFVSEGTMYDEELFIAAFNKERYAKDIKVFLQSLFEDAEYCKYQKMLAKIFPNINKYCENPLFYRLNTDNIKKIIIKSEIDKKREIQSNLFCNRCAWCG